MKTKFIEGTSAEMLWGKFAVARFDPDELARCSAVDDRPLVRSRGWGPDHIWVLDLQTGEGAFFRPGGLARADLKKKRIWVCPLFEHFLGWLYTQDLRDLDTLPSLIEVPIEKTTCSYRREGPDGEPVSERVPESGVAKKQRRKKAA